MTQFYHSGGSATVLQVLVACKGSRAKLAPVSSTGQVSGVEAKPTR